MGFYRAAGAVLLVFQRSRLKICNVVIALGCCDVDQMVFNDPMTPFFLIVRSIRCINAPCGAFAFYKESRSVKTRPRRVSAVGFSLCFVESSLKQKPRTNAKKQTFQTNIE